MSMESFIAQTRSLARHPYCQQRRRRGGINADFHRKYTQLCGPPRPEAAPGLLRRQGPEIGLELAFEARHSLLQPLDGGEVLLGNGGELAEVAIGGFLGGDEAADLAVSFCGEAADLAVSFCGETADLAVRSEE